MLRKLLYLASRAEQKPVAQAAAAALLYALRYVPSAQAQQVRHHICCLSDPWQSA